VSLINPRTLQHIYRVRRKLDVKCYSYRIQRGGEKIP